MTRFKSSLRGALSLCCDGVFTAPCKLGSLFYLCWTARCLFRASSQWSRLVRWLWSSVVETSQSQITPTWVSTRHGWRASRLEARSRSWWGKSEMQARRWGPSGGTSLLATDSPSKWRHSYSPSRDRLANAPIPSSLLACLHLMYEWSWAGEGLRWGRGVGEKHDVLEERQAISVCPLELVLWLFSVRSLSRDTQGIWKASVLCRTSDIRSLLSAEAETCQQDTGAPICTKQYTALKQKSILIFCRWGARPTPSKTACRGKERMSRNALLKASRRIRLHELLNNN